MANAPQFQSILDRPVSTIERPKPLPNGQYTWVVTELPREGVSEKKGTPYLEFTVRCLGPVDENTVDPTQLEEWLTRADGSKKTLSDVTMRLTFYDTPEAGYRLKDFVEHLGIEMEGSATMGQAIPLTVGREFIGTVKHSISPDGQMKYANIVSTAPVQE